MWAVPQPERLGCSPLSFDNLMIHPSRQASALLGLHTNATFYRDSLFWLFLALGPVVWTLMAGFVQLQPLPWFQVWSPALLSLVFWQPVIEELLFRGVIQGCLLHTAWGQKRLGYLSLANLVTSVAFSLAHMASHLLVWSILVLAPSLAFGILRERYDSVYPPIALHVFYNVGYFLLVGGGALQGYSMK